MAWLPILHTAYRQEEFMPLLLTVGEEDRHEEGHNWRAHHESAKLLESNQAFLNLLNALAVDFCPVATFGFWVTSSRFEDFRVRKRGYQKQKDYISTILIHSPHARAILDPLHWKISWNAVVSEAKIERWRTAEEEGWRSVGDLDRLCLKQNSRVALIFSEIRTWSGNNRKQCCFSLCAIANASFLPCPRNRKKINCTSHAGIQA